MFNQNRLTVVVGGIVFVLTFFIVQYQIFTRGIQLSSVMTSLAVLSPFIAMAAVATRRLWIGTLIGLMTITITIPLPVLSRLTPGLFFAMMVIGLEIIRGFANPRRYALFRSFESRCMIVVTVGILGRVLWDRPGSANLGQTGGAGQAILYLVGGFAYLAVSMVAADRWDPKKNSRIMVLLGILGAAITVSLAALDGGARGAVTSVFTMPVWLIVSVTLAWFHNGWGHARILSWLKYILVVFITLGLSVITPFRSRPYFALTMIFMAAWGYHHLRRAGLALIVGGSLIACAMVAIDPEGMSLLTARALSTVRSVDPRDATYIADIYGISSEVGWQSSFRTSLARLAYEDIKRHPLFGKGFKFTAEDLANAASSLPGGALGTGDMALVLSGSYHNTVLALAVFCGLPVTLLFILAVIALFRRYVVLVWRQESSPEKLFGVALTAFFSVAIGQAVMNGDGTMFLVMCCCMGAMNGTLCAAQTVPVQEGGDPRDPVGLPKPAISTGRRPAWSGPG